MFPSPRSIRRTRSLAFAASLLALRFAYDHVDGAEGGGGGTAPAELDETAEPTLIKEIPDSPKADAPTPATAPAPTETAAAAAAPAPAPAPVEGTPDKALQKLQQDYAVMQQSLEDIKQLLQRPAAAPAAAAPAPAAPAASNVQDEIDQILAEGYEVDVEQTPKQLAKAMKAIKADMARKLDAMVQAQAEAQQQTLAQVEAQRSFEQLDQQVRAKNPAADLRVAWSESIASAKKEGYEQAGDKALRLRATQIFQAKVDALSTPPQPPAPPAPVATSPPTPAAASAAPAKTATAAPAITPGGASVRINTPGGNPRPAAPVALTEDEIDAKHVLVK